MTVSRAELLAEARRLRTAAPPGTETPAAFVARRGEPEAGGALDFSIMFFSTSGPDARPGLYDLVLEASEFADRNGFAAVWLPERHFDGFGGSYPDPAVLAAAIAARTDRLRLRTGSVVLPLHDPLRVAESWAMVDNLSGGRVDLGVASGWAPNDFVLAPGVYGDLKGEMRRRLDDVRALWRGDALRRVNGPGAAVDVRIFPRPLNPDLSVWVAITGNPESLDWAGRNGLNVLTMVLGGDLGDIGARVALYRKARAAAGLDPMGGRVALMLHTFVHPEAGVARDLARGPLTAYLRTSLDRHASLSDEGRALSGDDRDGMAGAAFERYTRTASLVGSPEDCLPVLEQVRAAGIDEVACLLDFGLDDATVRAGLPHLDALRRAWTGEAPAPVAAPDDGAVAVIGLGLRLPGAEGVEEFWSLLADGREAVAPPPPGRACSLPRAGLLSDPEAFDPRPFRLAPAEVAVMDPHQRQFLEVTRRALMDAGMEAEDWRGHRVGVFASVYSGSWMARPGAAATVDDALAVTGSVLSMTANRTSFVFDWTGPSETVNTACSSGLVAVHRAMRALAEGECAVAVAGGVSLLLADAESVGLGNLGILSADGRCRAFDDAANGQVRGEGAVVVILKPLAAALADGDPVRAVLRGSAVGHTGGRSGSLTLPSAGAQAECIAEAWARAGLTAADVPVIEAHGAGSTHGDGSELAAFATVVGRAGAVAVGSVKSNIGSLDAAGGVAALAKAVLMVEHGQVAPTLNLDTPAAEWAGGPFRFPRQVEPWPAGRRRIVGVHAYGLGGTNAHVVVEASPVARAVEVPAAPPVARFYDYVAGVRRDDDELYLTLAPLAEVVPGFSWTRTMQEPDAHPDHHALMLAAQRQMRDVLFAGADMARVKRVLDFGCGFGSDLIALARRYPGLEGVGYTLAPRQAEAARDRVARRGLDGRVVIHCRDSARDAFPGPFDLAIGFEVAHHIADKEALFANLAAALVPGGTLLLADCVADTVAPIDLVEVGSHTWPCGDYADLFARHGLELVECVDCSAEIANFLHDPDLDDMLARERDKNGAVDLVEAVQRSWDGFGHALREGLVRYVLITARRREGVDPAANRRVMGVS